MQAHPCNRFSPFDQASVLEQRIDPEPLPSRNRSILNHDCRVGMDNIGSRTARIGEDYCGTSQAEAMRFLVIAKLK